MSDVSSLGPSGKVISDTANRLKSANLIDEAQFRELTNTNVGPQDIAIANGALDKIQANTPDAMNLMFSIPKMNNAVLDIQRQGLSQRQSELQQAQQQRSGAQATTPDQMCECV